MKRVLLGVVMVVLLTTACSSGGRSEEDLVADLKDGLLSEDTGFGLTDEEATCAAQGMFDALGLHRAREIDKDDDGTTSLTPEEADAAAQAVVGCADLRPVFVSTFADLGSVSDQSAGCLAAAIGDDQLIALLASAFSGADSASAQSEISDSLVNAMPTCLTEEEMTSLANG